MNDVLNILLAEIESQLHDVIKGVEGMDRIKGDTADLLLKSIEKKTALLRELIDFRMEES